MTNPNAYTRRFSRATGSMLVAVAGPAMNLLMAIFVSVLVVVGLRTGIMGIELGQAIIESLVILNLSLLFFNLLPIPPLDGGSVLAWVLPRSMQGAIEFLNRFGFLILLALMMTPLLGYITLPGRWLAGRWYDALLGVAGI